jgi:DNA-binding response OmpR family regulator
MAICILIAEDEPAVTNLLAYNLRKVGYEILTAVDGRQALSLALQSKPDLVLLDLMLPKMDGLDVCRVLRKTSQVPVIMLTARGEEIDRVLGLELGADDYVCKPFSMRELMSRIKAVLRRVKPVDTSSGARTILRGRGGLELDQDSRTVNVREVIIPLTRLEFDILELLLLNTGRVLTREQLLEQAWGYDFVGATRAVDSAIKRLRSKLRGAESMDSSPADSIEAVRGIGYRLIV